MALILTLKEGQDFYVGEEQFIVEKVHNETHFIIRDAETQQLYEITDECGTEVLPKVFISAGERPSTSIARVAINAPYEMVVLRGDKKRNPSTDFVERQRK